MSSKALVQAATVDKFIQGWKGWTPEGFLATWSDDCHQKTLPFSFDVPVRTRAHCEHIFPVLMSVLTNFQLDVHNILHDVSQGKSAIYALAKAEAPFGHYQNEHALFMWFDESREKIVKIEEMFDTVVMKETLPKLDEYLKKMKENEGPEGAHFLPQDVPVAAEGS